MSTATSAAAGVPRLLLQKQVRIDGWGVRGYKRAHLTFTPAEKPGWFWRPEPGAQPLPINRDVMGVKKRSVLLAHRDRELNIYEHIGCLRFSGIDGVILESTPRPPYHGRALEVFEPLHGECKGDGTFFDWVYLKTAVKADIPQAPWRYVTATPLTDGQAPGLYAKVFCAYPHLGEGKTHVFQIPGEDLTGIWKELTPGMPRWLYRLSKWGHEVRLWRNHHCINWGRHTPPAITLDRFIRHRFQDLLGALCLVDHLRLPAMNIESHMGGHRVDIDLIHHMELQ